jgi:hypothetical protein
VTKETIADMIPRGDNPVIVIPHKYETDPEVARVYAAKIATGITCPDWGAWGTNKTHGYGFQDKIICPYCCSEDIVAVKSLYDFMPNTCPNCGGWLDE